MCDVPRITISALGGNQGLMGGVGLCREAEERLQKQSDEGCDQSVSGERPETLLIVRSCPWKMMPMGEEAVFPSALNQTVRTELPAFPKTLETILEMCEACRSGAH